MHIVQCTGHLKNENIAPRHLTEKLTSLSLSYDVAVQGITCHKYRMTTHVITLCKVGKKAGNTHISQDGGKYW